MSAMVAASGGVEKCWSRYCSNVASRARDIYAATSQRNVANGV